MSFGKGFLIGLVLFIAINVIMNIVVVLVGGGSFDTILAAFTNISAIGSLLFGSIIVTPGLTIFSILLSFVLGEFSVTLLLSGLALFIAPLVASLVAGKMSESKGQAFLAWFLVCIVSAIVLWVLHFIGGTVSALALLMAFYGLSIGGISGEFMILVVMIIVAVVNGIFYGTFAMLTCSEEW